MRKPKPESIKVPEPPLTKDDIRALIKEELRIMVNQSPFHDDAEIKLMLGEEEIGSGSINL